MLHYNRLSHVDRIYVYSALNAAERCYFPTRDGIPRYALLFVAKRKTLHHR